jgi:uncharacterized protein YceK
MKAALTTAWRDFIASLDLVVFTVLDVGRACRARSLSLPFEVTFDLALLPMQVQRHQVKPYRP